MPAPKALTLNQPTARVIGEPTASYSAASDEFGGIRCSSPPSKEYAIGDVLELIVPHCDPVVNLYDQRYGIRKVRRGHLAGDGSRRVPIERSVPGRVTTRSLT